MTPSAYLLLEDCQWAQLIRPIPLIVTRVVSSAAAFAKTLVLSHLTPAIDSIDDETWRAPVAKYFKGEIIVGKDLMVV
jgi:hypothetical protein